MKGNDQLFVLIKSLTKSEKRSFKLYAKRIQGDADIKFLKLFDVLDKQKDYDESAIFMKIPALKKIQLSNMKAHLYRQILISLRLIHINYNKDIEIREQLDYARVLYNKGLYKSSLKLLDKIKQQSVKYNLEILTLEIIDFEKLIESRFITGSIKERAQLLAEESELCGENIILTNKLSNLALRLYGLYLKVGYARSEKDYFMVKEFFESNLPTIEKSKLSFNQKLYLYQSYVWYYYIIQDFVMSYRYAQNWVDLFESNDKMKKEEPGAYMKGLHNLLAALFNVLHHDKFLLYLKKLEKYIEDNNSDFTENTSIQAFIYLRLNQINLFFLEGRFTEGTELVHLIEQDLSLYYDKIDHQRVLTFNYKIACLYFGSGDNKMTIKYLNKIINFKVGPLKEDIHCFSRILSLIAHFELGNEDLLEYQIKSVYRFLLKMNDMHLVQQEIFHFLRRSFRMDRENLNREFKKLLYKLKEIKQMRYERRAFLYLDIISWLESKVEGKKVQEVISSKFISEKAKG